MNNEIDKIINKDQYDIIIKSLEFLFDKADNFTNQEEYEFNQLIEIVEKYEDENYPMGGENEYKGGHTIKKL